MLEVCVDAARGAATLHEVMAGLPGTLTAAARRGRRERDLTGWTIGRVVPMSGERNDLGVLTAFDSAVRELERLGAEVVDVSVPCFGDLLDVYLAVTSVEAIPVLREHEGRGLGHEARSRLEIGQRLSGTHELAEAHSLRRRISADAREVLTRCRLMISPTVPLVAPPLGRHGMDDPLARPRTDWWTVEANLAGLAAMSLPVDRSAGLPVGLQLMTAPGDDAVLYRVGAAMEAAVAGR
ncbi:amidase family protein [Janibacter sp. GS2]|uniref:amidase family protein n=1 Tax=Janibacter sp. GS2 TaxID=3442646 RepID=UPI003EBE5312